MPDFVIPLLILIDGLIAVGLSLFAREIGLDPDPNWGKGRIALLAVGAVLCCIFVVWSAFKDKKTTAFSIFRSEGVKTWVLLAHLWGILFMVYAWFITYGNFTTWDHTTHYYTQLAEAFGKGQLYVDQEPGSALLEAPDPYSVTSQPAISDEVWDLSFYKEKLYLYWGPVPALMITPLQMALGGKITDNYLAFLFCAGLLIVNSLMVIRLRRDFFPEIPARNMFVCIALIGLILPVSWSLNAPNVYTAAIGAGQFFLLGGIYLVFLAVKADSFPTKKYLFLAGVFWACAVGSRAIIALSVVFCAVFMAFWLAREFHKPIRWGKYLQAVSALYAPLILGAAMIGWYNWARFDSPFEFGLRYQITIYNLNRDAGLTFRPEYFPFNFYLYLFQPFEFVSRFPFIEPLRASEFLRGLGIHMPYLYLPGRLTGLLFGMPFLALALAHPILKNRIARETPSSLLSRRSLVVTLLAGSFLVNFLAVLFYFFGQMRFLVDIISQITLLAILGYWEVLSFRRTVNSFWPRALVFLANFLVIFTLCTSLLLAISGEMSRMEQLNPALFDRINDALSISE